MSVRVALTSLQNELLIQILGYLPYWDLKLRIPLVCTQFADLIEDRSGRSDLDRALFRDDPITPQPSLKNVKLHPILDAINFIVKHGGDEFTLLRNTTSKFAVSVPREILDENVTTPGVTSLALGLLDTPWVYDLSIPTMSQTAITVRHLLDMVSFYLEGIDDDTRNDIDEEHRSSGWEVLKYKKVWEGIEVEHLEDGTYRLLVVSRSKRCESDLGGLMP